MTWLWGSVLVLLLALVGFVVGGMLGASTVPDGAGFEGGATVVVWGLAWAVLLALLGVMLVRRAIARRRHAAQAPARDARQHRGPTG